MPVPDTTPSALPRVLGADLRVGDHITVWWTSGPAKITSLTPYTGPLVSEFKHGALIAEFDIGPGMTIDKGDLYQLASPRPESEPTEDAAPSFSP